MGRSATSRSRRVGAKLGLVQHGVDVSSNRGFGLEVGIRGCVGRGKRNGEVGDDLIKEGVVEGKAGSR